MLEISSLIDFPEDDNKLRIIEIATNESLPKCTSLRITPPFPSPPISMVYSFIFLTTCASPILVLIVLSAMLSSIIEVDRLVTTILS